MLKIFLVDDETIIREGIRKNIPWEKNGLTVVGEASDGELAYPMIKKEMPDIVITDIKMPFMDGLELSELIKKELPDTKILILTGYGEFVYAKKAIDIGITSYLLKPVAAEALLEAVLDIAAQIRQEQETGTVYKQYKEAISGNMSGKAQTLFEDVMSGNMTCSEMIERGKRIGIELAAHYYQVMLFQVSEKNHGGDCRREICAMLERQPGIQLFRHGVDGTGVLLMAELEDELAEKMHRIQDEIEKIVSRHRNAEWISGYGSVKNRLNEICDSYRDSNIAFTAKIFHDQTLPKLEDVDPKKINRSVVYNFLVNSSEKEIKEFTEGYIKSIGEHHFKSLLFRQYIIMNCYFAVSDFEKEIGIVHEETEDAAHIVRSCKSIEEIKNWIEEILRRAIESRKVQSQKKYASLLEQARLYINEHYADEQISLNKTASAVKMSANYFSRIFVQEMGFTFTEYLTRVRINRAKELLMCTNKKIAGIAYETGYKDSHYFSYIFKKTVGMTPMEYRNRSNSDRS